VGEEPRARESLSSTGVAGDGPNLSAASGGGQFSALNVRHEDRTRSGAMRRAIAVYACLVVTECSGETLSPTPSSTAPRVDLARAQLGVPDRTDDPAVVALEIDGQGACAGTLLAPDVILTAARCVPQAGKTLRVLVGDSSADAQQRAQGSQVLLVPPAGTGLAVVFLDTTIDDIAPLAVRASGVATGDHVRSVGFLHGRRLVRDHLTVLGAERGQFEVAEAACAVGAGGPALDESSGEVLGVLTNGGENCAASADADVYASTDVSRSFLAQAVGGGLQAVAKHAQKTKKGPVDMGSGCVLGSDCAAGVCVDYAASQYCSRTCDAHDRCPARFKCMATQSQIQGVRAVMVCVEN